MQDGERRGDDKLVARIAAGDQGALAQLIARHGRGLRVFAARYLGNASDAEDVVQDVFVSVWKNAGRFDSQKASASTWLYRITANRCIDRRRRRAFRSFIGLDDLENDPASETPDVDAAITGRQELSIARDGLTRLPERQRMALLLRVVGDLDVPAIAEVMGSSAGSVEQLLVRARRGLRDHMKDHMAGHEAAKGKCNDQR
ncbi:sigma-70 family RNA polymerase sigma factor [Mesorhizobium sp. CA13]|uniref:RNA polymerase sigma factor n=1 Tax=unclassified Mesorhizobium TaxID=325217 RepID=UPI001CCB198D|nr:MULTISPECIES: sigma-70 family RNA polymerase sigma factor [unclassified Mesorhizobium]MBZ9857415.1 sigma-70 family RNA polymerase sigma factor [Mesorhizobium sp. CA13]MBZ9921843.1 sigma-70 family RNA polymerase sigma factor [Mesorhizobium sp. BR1-1-7]MBZ9966623.1 sigma-70 family RNA polymerase sigma factor [Mesorhizobium sp. BR1-1-2]MCA0014783.1 sigma-70 family RNA polymerase sigma factor [Mesorhizobium sp. B294B1A1]MCA0041096.1 sigma-70 family RNA polymerase sigma factor [Mesorhizobium sp.